MHPILTELPAKLLFVAALAAAAMPAAAAAHGHRDAVCRRCSLAAAVLWIAVAWALLQAYGGVLLPTPARLSAPWPLVPISSFSVALAAALVAGWVLARQLAPRAAMGPATVGALCLWTAVGGVAGARALGLFVAFAASGGQDAYASSGLVSFGGLLGGAAVGFLVCRLVRVPCLVWADIAAPSVALGQALGRLGCWLEGCDFGSRTALPWGVRYPAGRPAWHEHVARAGLPRDALRSLAVHPVQLYEAAGALMLLALSLRVRRRSRRGEAFAVWALGYGLLRFALEHLRGDADRGFVGPLSVGQLFSLGAMALGLVLLGRLARQNGGINAAALTNREGA